MKINYYPNSADLEGVSGPLSRFFKELKEDPQLFSLVIATLTKVEKGELSIEMLERQEMSSRLKHAKKPIHEFRIPPRRGRGVARLYYGYKINEPGVIIVLSAEIKKGKPTADKEKIKQAEKRYSEVCL